MRPARLCRAIAAPTWFGRAPLHAAAISGCVLPSARTRTRSLRLGELRLGLADFVVVVRGRASARAGEAAFFAAFGDLVDAVLLIPEPLLYRASTRSVASSSASWPASFSR